MSGIIGELKAGTAAHGEIGVKTGVRAYIDPQIF